MRQLFQELWLWTNLESSCFSIARPGGNATGMSSLLSELGAKQLGLLRELVPTVSLVGLLVNPAKQEKMPIYFSHLKIQRGLYLQMDLQRHR